MILSKSPNMVSFFSLKMFYLRMDGWMDGWTEYQKCPSMFFILCRYIEHVYIYTYIYIYSIIAANNPMGFKIWCQVGVWGTQFSKLPYVREFSNIWFQTYHFRFRWSHGVLKNHPFFRKSQKPFCIPKLKTYDFVRGTRTWC